MATQEGQIDLSTWGRRLGSNDLVGGHLATQEAPSPLICMGQKAGKQ